MRPWATAIRIPTSGGTVWFKATIPVLAHEAFLRGEIDPATIVF